MANQDNPQAIVEYGTQLAFEFSAHEQNAPHDMPTVEMIERLDRPSPAVGFRAA